MFIEIEYWLNRRSPNRFKFHVHGQSNSTKLYMESKRVEGSINLWNQTKAELSGLKWHFNVRRQCYSTENEVSMKLSRIRAKVTGFTKGINRENLHYLSDSLNGMNGVGMGMKLNGTELLAEICWLFIATWPDWNRNGGTEDLNGRMNWTESNDQSKASWWLIAILGRARGRAPSIRRVPISIAIFGARLKRQCLGRHTHSTPLNRPWRNKSSAPFAAVTTPTTTLTKRPLNSGADKMSHRFFSLQTSKSLLIFICCSHDKDKDDPGRKSDQVL